MNNVIHILNRVYDGQRNITEFYDEQNNYSLSYNRNV